jgi:hypothetical protein
MKRHLLILLCLTLAAALLTGAGLALAADQFELIGSVKCKMCHKKDSSGNQWAKWEGSQHAKAFATLASDEAKAIATEKGLGDPQKEAACLKCHATQHFLGSEVKANAKGKYADTEGVGCEACHGPGSAYKKKSIMKDSELSKQNGLHTPEGESFCIKCHNEESPTFEAFNYKERWAKITHPVPTEE